MHNRVERPCNITIMSSETASACVQVIKGVVIFIVNNECAVNIVRLIIG